MSVCAQVYQDRAIGIGPISGDAVRPH